tara:strand:- start:836 stop:1084 length:249 start_codon:yes stop_codon:yes gene_type:complete
MKKRKLIIVLDGGIATHFHMEDGKPLEDIEVVVRDFDVDGYEDYDSLPSGKRGEKYAEYEPEKYIESAYDSEGVFVPERERV